HGLVFAIAGRASQALAAPISRDSVSMPAKRTLEETLHAFSRWTPWIGTVTDQSNNSFIVLDCAKDVPGRSVFCGFAACPSNRHRGPLFEGVIQVGERRIPW
ncbi:MAG TPA: hypothetical protein VGG61_13950, partial [Gemmataceae bacterium]